ncbi:hypothetical protein [Pseudobacter ginsenosidimutans]|uniref:hypothetical protein n=1 Tax=Pseudobacter ginsenosidimutans TaxID=661488 RepID=UPI001F5FC1CC|nr:hypothetical protein [Pseudobacter ginsenosidimutans]
MNIKYNALIIQNRGASELYFQFIGTIPPGFFCFFIPEQSLLSRYEEAEEASLLLFSQRLFS